MSGYFYGIYEAVVQAASGDLILFFVIMAVMVLPLYAIIIKDRKASRQHDSEKQNKYIEREKEVITVIKENSAVIASVKTLLENQGSENRKSIERINERIDAILTNIMQIKFTLGERECLKDNDKNKE